MSTSRTLRAIVALVCLLGSGVLWPASARAVPVADPSQGRDFHLSHAGWNGLLRFVDLTNSIGCPVEPVRALDWSALDGHDILWVLHPESPLDPEALYAFLSAGGRAVLSDDYGSSDRLLSRLGIHRETAHMPPGTLYHRQNPALPIATRQRQTPIARSAEQIIANHAVFFRSALPATYEFTPGAALVVEGKLENGRFVAIADSSLFINNMLDLDGNRDFLSSLTSQFCRPGRDRILLLSGTFSAQGQPPHLLAGAPLDSPMAQLAERLNQSAVGANLHVQKALAQRVLGLDGITLLGLLFCITTLALLARYIPMTSRRPDARFAQSLPQFETGLGATIARYSKRQGQRVTWGFAYPATLLREEVYTRLVDGLSRRGIALTKTPRLPDLVAHVRTAISPRAADLTQTLLTEFVRLDAGITPTAQARPVYVSARLLKQWYDVSVELFAELSRVARQQRPALASTPSAASPARGPDSLR